MNCPAAKTQRELPPSRGRQFNAANSDVALVVPMPGVGKTSDEARLLLLPLGLIALQILDGVLTLTGMLTFGEGAEGNPILRGLMSQIGLIPALLITKLACIGVVIMLWAHAARISWLPTALSFVAGVYTLGAVIPWSVLLLSSYFA
jgi:hypothetical protein